MVVNGFNIDITRVQADHYRAEVFGSEDYYDTWADFATHAEAKAWAINYANHFAG